MHENIVKERYIPRKGDLVDIAIEGQFTRQGTVQDISELPYTVVVYDTIGHRRLKVKPKNLHFLDRVRNVNENINTFDQLCEQMGIIKNTTRMYYPRNLQLSDKFLSAFKEEYKTQRKMFNETSNGKPFQPQLEKMLKALKFHAVELDEEFNQSRNMVNKKFGPKMLEEAEPSKKTKVKSTSQDSWQTFGDTIKARKNCDVCHGLGAEYFADSFDRDNGRPCWKCEKWAKAQGKRLRPPYQR